MKDNLGQDIVVGSLIAYCYNLWKGKDEIRVAKVSRLTATRVYMENGTWCTPTKVFVVTERTEGIIEKLMEIEERNRKEEEEEDFF